MYGSLRRCLSVLAMVALGACSGEGSSGRFEATAGSSSAGTLSVKLTDAPAESGLAKVFVTIERISVLRAGADTQSGAGWSEIVLDPPRKIELLSLRNGLVVGLGKVQLAAGSYDRLRLVLGRGTADNTIVLASQPGVEIPMSTPSGLRDGLELHHPFRVGAGETVELTLDFDAARSVVMSTGAPEGQLQPPTLQAAASAGGAAVPAPKPATAPATVPATAPLVDDGARRVSKPVLVAPTEGSSGAARPLLKPSIAVIPTVSDGMPASGAVTGAFDDDSANGATVSLQAHDAVTGVPVVRRSTVVDQRRWTLDPVPPGRDYRLVIARPGYRTVVLTGVDVVAGAVIGPIALGALEAARTLRVASGKVVPVDPAAGRDARVRALQRVGGDAADEVFVEVAATMTPLDTGAFTLSLPVDAARVARFAMGPLAWTSGAGAGIYTLHADGLDAATGGGTLAFDASTAGHPAGLVITARR